MSNKEIRMKILHRYQKETTRLREENYALKVEIEKLKAGKK